VYETPNWTALNQSMHSQTELLLTRACTAKPRPASPNCHARSALFWDITQRRVV